MNLRKIVAFAVLSLLSVAGFSQQKVQSAPSGPKTIQWFFEKTYLHTDREYYSSGEDIWFSAYLVNGRSANLTATSNNLYVELISPAAGIVDRKVVRLDNGLGRGDFKLRDSIPGGWYQLRAYTNWMRNFEDLFVFQKKVYIHSNLPQKNPSAVTLTESIQLFPEGGALVQDVTGVVAFKALDQQGDGIRVKGKVLASNGQEAGAFESTEQGMGIFTVSPVTGLRYHVEGTYANGKGFTVALPDPLSKGISLHVVADSLNVKAVISVNDPMLAELKDKEILLSVKHGGNSYIAERLKMNKATIVLLIPLKDLPQGLNCITIADSQGRPHCERLIYVPGKPVHLSVVPDKTSYQPQEKVNLTIKVSDEEGKPVKAHLSLSAVDAIVPGNQSDIRAYLWLESEIRGKIQNPDQYFNEKNPGRAKQLDLLLMTQGWRDYVWKRLEESKPVMSYMPEPGITISGNVRQKIGNKVLPGMNITLFGNGLTGDKIYMTKSRADGSYFLDGLNWYGDQPVKLSSKDEKGKKGGWITVDSLFKNPMKIKPSGAGDIKIPDLSVFQKESARRMDFNRIAKINEAVNLKEVEIDGGDKKGLRLRDEVLMTFGYPDLVYNITPADYDYRGLEHFLLTKVPGTVSLSDTTDGIAFIAKGKKSPPRLVINKREDLFERLDYYSLPMNQINKIVVRHLVRNGGDDAYVINLDLKEEAFKGTSLDVLNTTLPGYYQAREFYVPPFQDKMGVKQDLRTTVFWAPSLSTNEQGETKISFLNADPKTTILIQAEGLTSTGVPVAGTARYQVK